VSSIENAWWAREDSNCVPGTQSYRTSLCEASTSGTFDMCQLHTLSYRRATTWQLGRTRDILLLTSLKRFQSITVGRRSFQLTVRTEQCFQEISHAECEAVTPAWADDL
jgi:hypothetical protein